MSRFVDLDHPRFVRAERAVFVRRVTQDCMSHTCRLRHDGHRVKLDACCQYGVDVDLGERDGIIAHREQIAALLRPEPRALPWFATETQRDPDFPSGAFVRTRTFEDGCIFLAHDGRGCAVHRAALEGGWDMNGVKPHVCRLFPLSYDTDSIVLSDDYTDYSCSQDAGAPTVYRVARDAIAEIFGATLVAALDAAEAQVAAGALRVAAL